MVGMMSMTAHKALQAPGSRVSQRANKYICIWVNYLHYVLNLIFVFKHIVIVSYPSYSYNHIRQVDDNLASIMDYLLS